MLPLALREILAVFVNTLTADGKYPLQDWESFTLPVQMQFCEKQKYFSRLFVPFLESTSNFNHFEKKNDCHS